MDNRWSEEEVRDLSGVDLLVHQSRLVGAAPNLVIWGGGNTSLKVIETDFLGRETRTLRIKASGSDMKAAQSQDFPAVRLDDILPLYDLVDMTDRGGSSLFGPTACWNHALPDRPLKRCCMPFCLK